MQNNSECCNNNCNQGRNCPLRAATPAADAKKAEFEAIRMFWAQHGSQKVLNMNTLAELHSDVECTIRQHATAAAPVVLPEQDATLLNQGVELLHALSNDERNRGNCSAAEGAAASAHAVQRLAALLATGGQAQADARDAEQERWMEIGKAIERACIDQPESTEIVISLERDAGTVTMFDPDGNEHDQFSHEDGLAGVVNEAIDAAIAAAKENEK